MTGDAVVPRTIKSLARRYAPGVLAEAVRVAQAQATTELAALLTKAIVTESMAEAGSPSQPPARQPVQRELCVYVIVRGRHWDHVEFPVLHGGSIPRVVTHDDLGLVVADIDVATFSDLDANPSENGSLAILAREHDAVVRAAFEHGAVLPLRFGTIVNGEDAARRLLASRHDEVAAWLDRVEGHREWGLRIDHVDLDEPAEVPLEGLSGTEYLRQRSDAVRSSQDRAKTVESLHTGLSGYATDAVRRERQLQALLDAAYLVAGDKEASFRAEMERLSAPLQQLGMTVRHTGPWPPYSFTRIELAVDR